MKQKKKQFNYDVHVNAIDNEEANAKLVAGLILIDKLSLKEIEKLAHIVEHDPIKTALAKKALGV